IIGTALNLSASARDRRIITIKNRLKDPNKDFSVLVWVKAATNCDSSYDILSTIPPKGIGKNGWTIGMHASGAWYWSAKSKYLYNYSPTAQRQTVKDGEWHLLAFTYSQRKNVVRLYYDGLNTAIYFAPNLDSLNKD